MAAKGTHGALELAGAVRQCYAEGQTDYSLEPLVMVDAAGNPSGLINDGDSVIFCCRRGEREIQLTEAFVEPQTGGFPRKDFKRLFFVILTLYHEKFKDLPVAFAPAQIKGTLGEIVSAAGLRQLRISESEKYAHVTFFFSGGTNQPFPGEVDRCIPSPRGVPFDQLPELSLAKVTDAVINGIDDRFELIVTNFANGDVIGHTSNLAAKIDCARAIDQHLARVIQAALAGDYVVMITADHGNLEQAITPEGTPHVSHSENPVPFVLIASHARTQPKLHEGKLADVAPTVLAALGLKPTKVMTGKDLVEGKPWEGRQRVLLLILDGWGIGRADESNPIHLASTPIWDGLLARHPHTILQAAGEAVGLKTGKAGNSEAGHINMGAGRVVLQDDVRLDQAMSDGSFTRNGIFTKAMENVVNRNSGLHLIGLLTEKSSHGSIEYPLALLQMAKDHGVENICLHVIFDGRSTEPGSAPRLLEELEHRMDLIDAGRIASGIGRGIALDRDGNYAKTQKAYDMLVFGKGRKVCV